MKKIFFNSESSVNVIFKSAYDQIELLKPSLEPIFGLNNTTTVPVGSTCLLVTVGSAPLHKSVYVSFLIIDQSSPYNAFLGRPTPIDPGAVIS